MKVLHRSFWESFSGAFRGNALWVAAGVPLAFGIARASISTEPAPAIFRFDPGALSDGAYEHGWRSIWTSNRQMWRIESLHDFPHLDYDNIRIATNGAPAEAPETPRQISQVRLRHRHGDPFAVASSANAGGDAILVPVETARPNVFFSFHTGAGIAYPISDDEHRIELEVADPSIARFEIREDNPFAADLFGVAAGATSVVVRCLRDGAEVFRSAPIPIEVSSDREWREWVDKHTSFPWADPEEVGMSPDGLEEMKRTLQRYVATEEIVGGTMMVVRSGKLVFFETNGWNDIERGVPLHPNQIYQLRSMTKKATAVSLMMLMEEGRIGLDDRVSQYLDGWENAASRDITVHQLLSHTAGLRGSIDRGAPSLLEAGQEVGRQGPAFEPGTRYRYSDAGSTSVGALVALLSGHEGCEPFKHERILKPLKMHDTFCNQVPDGDPRIARVAARYSGGKGNWSKYSEAGELESDPWCRASGGMYSTVFDWSRFMAALLNGGEFEGARLLRPDTVELATQVPHSAYAYNEEERAEETRYYGYHFEMATDIFGNEPSPMSAGFFGHGGSDGLFAFADPNYDLIALFFTQSRFHRRTGENSRERFFELVYGAITER